MISFDNVRRVRVGEDWNLDILLCSNDKREVPFIISRLREHPCVAITVASEQLDKREPHKTTWWCTIDDAMGQPDFPRFNQTTPQDLGELTQVPYLRGTAIAASPYDCLYVYTLQTDPIDPETGFRKTHTSYVDSANVQHDDDYEARLRFNFPTTETEKWTNQNYSYQITLMSGQPMDETITEIIDANPLLNWPKTLPERGTMLPSQYLPILKQYVNSNLKTLFYYIKTHLPCELQIDIDWDAPLGRTWCHEEWLPPTKLTVDNNLRHSI